MYFWTQRGDYAVNFRKGRFSFPIWSGSRLGPRELSVSPGRQGRSHLRKAWANFRVVDGSGIDGDTGVSRINPNNVIYRRLLDSDEVALEAGFASDYLFLRVDYDLEPVAFAPPRRCRRTTLTFPDGPPPQKN